MFDLAGLKCEPGFGELISPAGDATVSARVYRSKGVTGTRHQTHPGLRLPLALARGGGGGGGGGGHGVGLLDFC